MIVIRRIVFKIGVETLLFDGADYWVSLKNKTYSNVFKIPREREDAWFKLFGVWRLRK